ncbi:hypothetical protein [Polluticaenibacter yanchengensis]|uniref:DUF3375 family protein n=1 Tax=Polluticaenibacter yanchengensis TaxID=3014562 RepID=A0ABT4UPJ3_9BACT|nr:hypothetical protein [Chitinophagaceae bacterium LY-5]
MKHFGSLKELINTLNWSKDLLSEMFEKRKSYLYKYDQALELLESEDKLNTLINKEIINQNGAYIDLDENFLEFFEQILEVNEEVNTSYIQEVIKQIKQNIFYYLQENNENRKYGYLKIVKNQLRKVGRITIRNVVDLNRNIENAFKTEPNYKIKISKLEAFDEKRRTLTVLIEQTEMLITEQDSHFFKAALDDELKIIVTRLRQQLTESRHNLIETQKQIIEYLNQVKHQSTFIEKIKQVKYLKDQFELKAKSNLIELLQERNVLCFEPKPSYRFKINLSKLHTDEGAQLIEKAQSRLKKPNKNKLPVAESIAADSLQALTENEIFINLKAIRDSFKASGNNLFDFIMAYNYPREVSYEEKITIFCQMASMYETEFEVKESFKQDGKVEYAIVYPGK